MSGFNNSPFQFNPSAVSSTNTTVTNTTAPMNTAGMFTNAGFPPPYSRPPMTINNPFGSSNLGFQNFSNPPVTQSLMNNPPVSQFRVDHSLSGFRANSPSKNVIGQPLFSSFQMPRPAPSWPGESRPFTFNPISSNVNQTVNSPKQSGLFPNQSGFSFSNPPSLMNSFSSVPFQPNTGAAQLQPSSHPPIYSSPSEPRVSAPSDAFGASGIFGQKMSQPLSVTNTVFGTFGNSEVGEAEKQNLFSNNLWNQPAKQPTVNQQVESKSKIENLPDVDQLPKDSSATEVNPKETSSTDPRKSPDVEPRKRSASRKSSVTTSRRSPGLFTKALAGLKPVSVKTSLGKSTTVERSRGTESRARRSSVKSSDGVAASREEIATFTSIICKGIPDDLNNRPTLLQHFGRFGIVRKIMCNVQKQSATITFENHEVASAAKTSGKTIRPDREPLALFWARSHLPHSRNERESSSSKGRDSKRSLKIPDLKPASSYLDDVEKELASMSSRAKSLVPPKLLERPREHSRSPKHQPAQLEAPSFRTVQESACRTSHDKYGVLDNVDKLLRLGMKRQSSLATAKAIIGTCPDMCPEKERYMREDRGQLHSYEVAGRDTSGEIVCDHRKTIKEYSRSSADQEEPLPHELRPPRVLAMTMHYLVCNIMDLHENSPDLQGGAVEWYDFVWNRTRSIRKDIIQQHLCDLVTVDVVEKCARFHIHCSARLCEEDMMTFDQRYNNENLTNCLQTLKHMYSDLRAKGQACKNESEFAAYDVLLNLNEGDIIRQISIMDPDVQQAPEIRLSLECANAISANNYVRFFKLVRRASYLRACILQRYFTQVRIKGFQSFVKAYCPNPNLPIPFPLGKLIHLFGFEDHAEATEFASFHNLVVDSDNVVILDRSRFSAQEGAVPLRRAKIVIESKRTCSVGELVNGGPLPADPLTFYEPQNSFDENGYLKREALARFDLGKHSALDPRLTSSVIRKAVDEPDIMTEVFNKVTDEIANDIVTETVNRMIETFASSNLARYLDFAKSTSEVAAQCLKEACGSMIIEVAVETFKSARAEELRNRMQKEAEDLAKRKLAEQQKEECSLDLLDTLIGVVVAQEIVKMSKQEISEEFSAHKKRCIENCSQQLGECLCQQWTDEMILEVSSDMHLSAIETRRSTLNRVAKKLSLWKSAEFFKIWRARVLKRKRMRSSMELFPSSVLCSTYLTKKDHSHPLQKVTLTSPLQSENDRSSISRLLDMKILSDDLQENIRLSYINLSDIARHDVYCGRNMTNEWRRNQHIYWKLLVASSSHLMNSNGLLTKWLQQKFIQPNAINQHDTAMDEVVSSVCYNNTVRPSTAISVKVVQPYDSTSWKKPGRPLQLQGTLGIVYFVEIPGVCDVDTLENIFSNGRNFLESMFDEIPPIPAVPLLVVSVTRSLFLKTDVCRRLELDTLKELGCVSEYHVIELSDQFCEPNSTQTLTEGLKWLGRNCPPAPPLRIDDVNHFLNKAIVEYVLPLVHQLKTDYISNIESPNAVINAFNHVIEHVAVCASDLTLCDISWPAIEFVGKYSDLPHRNWNSREHLQNLKQLICSHSLPLFKKDLTTCSSWSSLCSCLWDYIDQLQDAEWSHRTYLCARLQRLLERSHQKCNSSEYDSCIKPWQLLPWSEIINIFVDYHLTIASTGVEVVYDPATYHSFVKSKDWDLVAINKSAVIPLTALKRKVENSNLAYPKRRAPLDSFKKSDPMNELKYSCMELKRQLEIERERSLEFDKFLQSALKE